MNKKVSFSNAQKATVKKLNILNRNTETNFIGDQITFNSFKNNKYLGKNIYL